MNNELKDSIIKKVQENINEFQLHNYIVGQFSEYIFTKDGQEYLIGGEQVLKFINEFIKLYENI